MNRELENGWQVEQVAFPGRVLAVQLLWWVKKTLINALMTKCSGAELKLGGGCEQLLSSWKYEKPTRYYCPWRAFQQQPGTLLFYAANWESWILDTAQRAGVTILLIARWFKGYSPLASTQPRNSEPTGARRLDSRLVKMAWKNCTCIISAAPIRRKQSTHSPAHVL